MRPVLQIGFLGLTVAAVFLVGANAEAWCPFGGVEAIYTYAVEGNFVCSLGVSNLYILAGVLLSALLLRRAFCGYVCPIGAISEGAGWLARRLGIRRLDVPGRADAVLSLLKYPVLGVILFFTWRTAELVFRGYDPCYALLSRNGEDITMWAYVISGGLLAMSLFLSVPFCRWLCPLAAVLNPLSRFGATCIVRDAKTCTDCAKCGTVCPMAIPVDRVEAVTHARCTTCLDCVDACPKGRALALRGPGFRRRMPRAAVAAGILLLIAASVSASVLVPLPSFRWSRGEVSESATRLELEIDGLTCRGRANQLVWFLTRDDDLELPADLRLEAWPGPGWARAVLVFAAGATDAETIRAAIVEPSLDLEQDRWRESPFSIRGYDPLDLD
jgi:ferredoxin